MKGYFKELTYTIVKADKSEICRAGKLEIQVELMWQSWNPQGMSASWKLR